jgi:hypothetical protein
MNEKLIDYSTDFQRKEYGGNRHIKKASKKFELLLLFLTKDAIMKCCEKLFLRLKIKSLYNG